MISSGFAEDEPVIDVHDDFGGGLGNIHEKRLSLERENQIHAYFPEKKALPVYKISSPTKGHLGVIDQLLLLQTYPPRAIMFLESLTTFVGQFAHGDTRHLLGGLTNGTG